MPPQETTSKKCVPKESDKFRYYRNDAICTNSFFSLIIPRASFLDAQASLAPTQVSLSVRWSHFQISNLSASLVVLREKLKREDPNNFYNFGSGFFLNQKNFFDPKILFSTKKKFHPKNFFDPKKI